MKILNPILLFAFLILATITCQAQLSLGNFTVTGDWNVTIPTLQEAGLDYDPVVSVSNETNVAWRLDSGLGIQTINIPLSPPITFDPDLALCAGNIQNYAVFIHKERPLNLDETNDFKIFARRTSAGIDPSAEDFGPGGPLSGPVFELIRTFLGLPGLTDYTVKDPPTGGDSYIEIEHGLATEFFRFQGCRDDISVQYQLNPTVLTPVDSYSTEIIYTLVDETILESLGF